MRSYTIPHTDFSVSQIAYGCMGIGGDWSKNPPDEATQQHAARLIEKAMAAGINLFDHADIYCRGKSEIVFGQILKQKPHLRDKIILQSKCGIRFADDPESGLPGRYDFSYEHIVQSVEAILKRLQTDYLDLLLLHRPDPLMQPDEVAKAFDALKQAGKVRHFGVSNFNSLQIALLQKSLDMPIVVNQLEISLLHYHLIEEGISVNQNVAGYANTGATLDYCRMNDILVQAWGPLASGQLFRLDDQSPKNLHETASLVSKLATKKNCGADAILLSWLLRHPAGIQPIIGTTKTERIVSSSSANTIELSREEWYSLYVSARGQPMP
ncbi:MAG: aldo/keto reductase [Calditrichia bacterium]